jgi:hypothetical protein
MIIAINGICEDLSGETCAMGSGKSRMARRLVERHGFYEISLADALRTATQQLFGFLDEEIRGSSARRNEPVARLNGLTPRQAMNAVSDCVRGLRRDAFIERTIRRVQEMKCDVAIPDVRLEREYHALARIGARMVRTRRMVQDLPGTAEQRASQFERESELLEDSLFEQVVVHSSGPMAGYYAKVDRMLSALQDRSTREMGSPIVGLRSAPPGKEVGFRLTDLGDTLGMDVEDYDV